MILFEALNDHCQERPDRVLFTDVYGGLFADAHGGFFTDAHADAFADVNSNLFADAHAGAFASADSGPFADADSSLFTDEHGGSFTDERSNLFASANSTLSTDSHKDYTNKEVDYISGQVYGYLKSRGIGREDVVMIHLPRSADIAFVFYGILKAGACAVIVDANACEAHVNYFKRDASPVLEITPEVYRIILKSEYMSGYEEPNPNDAACIIYTSSSTSEPKGCIHEYGAIDWYLTHFDYDDTVLETSTERTALATEFYDVATISLLLDVLYAESYVYVVPREIARDPMRYADAIRERNLTTAILMHRFVDLDFLATLPSLKYLALGFEIVQNAYQAGVPVYNYYGMSESLLVVAFFQIDRSYDITPVGKPIGYVDVRVVDENLDKLPDGEIGRIAFSNPYFRGYLNKPEATCRAKRGGLFVSEDMGYINQQGDLVVVGRECDLIKTSEGYIVPAFVEAEMKKIFQDEQPVVQAQGEQSEIEKCFQGEQSEMEKRYQGEQLVVQAYKVDGENHVVVFHLDTLQIDQAAVHEKLSRALPSYMLPTDYIPLREIPLLTAGKLNRRALEAVFRSML